MRAARSGVKRQGPKGESRGLAAVASIALLALAALSCDEVNPPATNHEPYAPSVSGPVEVYVGELAEFSVAVNDPDGNMLRVFVAWGDGDTTDHGEFVASGQIVYFEHRYTTADTFEVRARCHDSEPLFSDWSGPRRVVAVNP
jgi:hypothetical protein